MTTITNQNLCKGMFVTLKTPLNRNEFISNSETFPTDTVFQVTYVSRLNPNNIKVYHNDLSYPRKTTASNCIVVDAPIATNNAVKINDVFAADWGYDQTQTTWFKVVGITKKSLNVVELDEKRVYTSNGMYGQATVNLNHIKSNPKRYILKLTSDGKPYFKYTSYACAFQADPSKSRFFSEWH